MNPRIKNEIRNLLPAFSVGIGLMGCSLFWSGSIAPAWQLFSFVIGCALIGVSCMGAGLTHATLTTELSYPIPRRVRWNEEYAVMIVALVCVGSIHLVITSEILSDRILARSRPVIVFFTLSVPLLAGTIGPLFTLWIGEVRAALFASLLLGSCLLLPIFDFNLATEFDSSFASATALVVIAAGVAGRSARRRFLEYQDYNPLAKPVTLPSREASASNVIRRRGPVFRLICLELRLQQINLISLAATVFVTIGYAVVMSQPDHVVSMAWLIAWSFPFLFGIASIAEEKRIGTRLHNLIQPVSARTRWCIKYAVNLCLAMLVFVGSYLTIETATSLLQFPHANIPFLFFAPAVAVGLPLCLTASALASHYLHAIANSAIIALVAVAGFYASAPFYPRNPGTVPAFFFVIGWFGAFTALTVLVGYRAFRSCEPHLQCWRTWLSWLSLAWAVTIGVTLLMLHRTWDLLTPRPADRPPIFAAGSQSQLWNLRFGYTIGPDQRLYATTYRAHPGGGAPFDWNRALIPIGNETNWVSLTFSRTNMYAIKADGTLWRPGLKKTIRHPDNLTEFIAIPKLVRVGEAADWRKVVWGAWGRFGGIRKDGSLWQWGRGKHGSFGTTNQIETWEEPVRVGNDNDWKDVRMNLLSFAIKTDGTLWRWGNPEWGKALTSETIDANQLLREPERVSDYGTLRFSEFVDSFMLRTTSGEVVVPEDWGKHLQSRSPALFTRHQQWTNLVVVHPRVDAIAASKFVPACEYLLSADGRLLQYDPNLPVDQWKALDGSQGWIEQSSIGNDFYYLKRDGSIWRHTPVKSRKHHPSHARHDLLFPPRFTLHRVGFLFGPGR